MASIRIAATGTRPNRFWLTRAAAILAILSVGTCASGAVTQQAPAPDGGSVAPVKSDKEVISESKAISPKPPVAPPVPNIVKDTENREITPDEIRQIKAMWEDMRRAQETPAGSQPKPAISMVNLNLSPGSTPPVVRLSSRTGVILDFMDSAGLPWPIDHVVNMSGNEIEVEDKPLDPKSDQNSVFAKSKHFGSVGNVAVFLRGLPTPVIVTMLSGQKDVDYRVDFRVPAYLHKEDGQHYDKSYFDDRLASATMGINPSGCKRFGTDSKQVMVWGCSEDMIVRVAGVLLSPAPLDGKKANSLDGTKAYIIPSSPVLSVSVDGEIRFVKVDIKDK